MFKEDDKFRMPLKLAAGSSIRLIWCAINGETVCADAVYVLLNTCDPFPSLPLCSCVNLKDI